jgi:hypothetical protein
MILKNGVLSLDEDEYEWRGEEDIGCEKICDFLR